MKKLLLLLTLALLLCTSYGQDYHKIDSLKQILNTLPEINGTDRDTLRMQVCLDLGDLYENDNPDSAIWWYASIADTLFSSEKIKQFPYKAKLNYKALRFIGFISLSWNDLTNAKRYYELSLKFAEELVDKVAISNSLCNLGIIYFQNGNYLDAAKYEEDALKIAEEIEDYDQISICLGSLGNVYARQSNYKEAVRYYDRSLKIAEELGDKSWIQMNLGNIGVLYNSLGNYIESNSYHERELKLSEELEDRIGIAYSLNSLGNNRLCQGKIKDAISLYDQSLKIFEEFNDQNGISSNLINLGCAYEILMDYSKAIELFDRGRLIAEEIEYKPWIVNSYENLGSVYRNKGEYTNAASYYEKSILMREELGDLEGIASASRSLANVNILLQNPKIALPLYLKSRKITLLLLQNNFSILSEKEKEMYFNNINGIFNDLNSFGLTYSPENNSISDICYNNELVLKGLLMKSTQTMLDAVYNSQDTILKNTYFLLKQYRNQASSLQGSEETTRDSLIADLEKKANEQERKLVKLSSEFANIQNLFNYKWEDVQKNLKTGEAAIEFVSFTLGDKNDPTEYAALMITPESKMPVSIKLFKDSQLQKIIDFYRGDDYQRVSNLYGTNQNINNELYNLIWQPLEQHLTGIKTVYFAPVGVLNKISFSALGDGKQMLCDKYNLQQVSSTGKLINQEPFSLQGNLTTAVFGGIDFNPDSAETQNLTSLWAYLPGTLSEKESVQKQLEMNKVAVTGFVGKEATEPAFKSLYADNGANPDILHIATHGFFYPDPSSSEASAKEDSSSTEKLNDEGLVAFRGATGCGTWQFVENKNPMMRSGLVFAGANRVWTEEWGRTDDEGVLTAQEVSQLNMKNTDLVVLSACETGLGDIKGSEGVYGLQRAFKMAGVKYIIMSLWQVPDKETQEFMTLFYSKLLKTKDVRTAFNETQKEMRTKYDPYFWAAFVLVE